MYKLEYTDEAKLHMQRLKHDEPKAFQKMSNLLLELIVVLYGSRYSINGKNTIESSRFHFSLLFLSLSTFLDDVLHIHQLAHTISLCTLLGLFSKVFYDVSGDDADALRMVQSLVFVDAPHLLTLYVALHLHGAFVVHMES